MAKRAWTAKRAKASYDKFLLRAQAKFKRKYSYHLIDDTKFKVNDKQKFWCPQHGEFIQIARIHLRSDYPCNKCAYEQRSLTHNKKNLPIFIKKATEVHKGKYDYSLLTIDNFSGKIPVICPDHGIFECGKTNHINGHECMLCALDKFTTIKYNNTIFNRNPDLKEVIGKVYYLKFENKVTNDIFYKIGITKNSINERFNKWYRDRYHITEINILETTMYEAFKIEGQIKEGYTMHKYIVPDTDFVGRTECFSIDILSGKTIKEAI